MNKPLTDLLISLCLDGLRGHRSQETLGRMAGLPDAGPLVGMAAHHKVRPLMLKALALYPDLPLGDRQKKMLEKSAFRLVKKSLSNLRALEEMFARLEERKIQAVLYRGLSWSHQLYGDLALREGTDIDIFVHRCDLPVIGEIMAGLGYRQTPDAAHPRLDGVIRHGYNFKYDRWDEAGDRTHVEPHYAACHKIYHLDLELSELIDRPPTVICLREQEIPVFSPDRVMLPMVVNNGIHEAWSRLKYLLDLHLFLEQYGEEVHWEEVRELMRKKDMYLNFLVGCHVCRSMLGTRVPLFFEQELAGKRVERLGKERIKRVYHWSDSYIHERWRRMVFLVRARESKLLGFKTLFSQFFVPTQHDFDLNLPEYAYPFVRPFRVFLKYFVKKK
ncbi:MAG: hypothetical protein RI973_92 [Bacteroidota bacterium]|jgi:hypothetical protein